MEVSYFLIFLFVIVMLLVFGSFLENRSLLVGWHRNLLLGFFLALIHFSILHRYSYPFMDFGAVLVTSDPLTNLLNDGISIDSVHSLQANYFTGNPFFLLPLFHFFGSGPGTQRTIMIFFAALATFFCFMAYKNIFEPKKAFIGILILFNFSAYLTFWTMDYPYVLAFIAVLFYLFTEWYERGKDNLVYLLAFLSGLFFYFKAIIAYFVISIGLATLIKDKTFVHSLLKPKIIVFSLILFLVGISPFLLYSIGTGFEFLQDAGSPDDNYGLISEAGYEPTLQNILGFRVAHLNYLMTPSSHYEIGSDFPYHPRLELPSFMTILLLISTLYGVYKKKTRIYGLTLFGLFAFSLYVTNDLNPQQLIILFPFIPISFLAIIERLMDSARVEDNNIYILTAIILTAGILISIPALHQTIQDIEPRESDADQKIYEDLERLELEGVLATNTWEIYQAAAFSTDITERKFVSPNNVPDKSFSQHLQQDQILLENYAPYNSNLLIYNSTSCPKSACGYNTTEILDYYDISNKDAVDIGGTQYILVEISN